MPNPVASPQPVVRLLDPHTVNQIAAGEVVERPASVVKELVENALDAGATWVEVRLEDYGRKLIEVADDGCGMDLETAKTSLQRHATSKIRRVEDLNSVATLGFRGEALPSIASVSRTTLTTALEDGVRSVLAIEGGQIAEPGSQPGPKGTTVSVRDLFFNTPARLKFLKSDATELAACVETVSRYAVAYPEVRFLLTHGPSVLVQTSGSGDFVSAVSDVWGRDVARAMAPVESFNGSARVRGFVSPPHFTRPTRAFQWFTVNNRPVRSKTLQAALDQAFRSLTPERRYPLAILHVDIDPNRVDVNVSPTKSEVRFHIEGAVFDAVRRGVTAALLDTGMVPHAEGVAAANAALQSASGLQAPLLATGFLEAALDAQRPLSATFGTDQPNLGEAAQPGPSFLVGLRVLGQVDDTFIIAENQQSLLVIDQHVAHERVIYERLRDSRGSGKVETQALLEPETLHLDRRSAELLGERIAELAAIGFQLEPFGGDSFIVRSVPALWRGRPPLQVLRDLADELADGLGQGCLTSLRDDVYIMCSCKMAVKAGDPLGMAEMERLIQDLALTENPYLCPHGRPITIVLPKSDLYRRFKR
ncbi:MAG: DNA mismatch repair endonuclease MutL [Armatimonadetes bacterium]|nr:DNA mismatch repair endonuclease MutL [Armatimonadota bacterium]